VGLDGSDKARLTRAAHFALAWHAEQHRKGSEVPYVSHLLQVAGLVLEHGGDVDQAVAGFLHDSLEDATSPEQRRAREGILRDEFGEDVTPWKERKSRYLEHLVHADARCALVTACDKRHNLGAMVGDMRAHGVQYLDRFNAGASDQVGYFEGVVEALRERIPGRLAEELEAVLADFRGLVG